MGTVKEGSEMASTNNIKKAWSMAIDYKQSGDYEIFRKLFDFAYKNDIFVCEGDGYVMVEDDVIYLND